MGYRVIHWCDKCKVEMPEPHLATVVVELSISGDPYIANSHTRRAGRICRDCRAEVESEFEKSADAFSSTEDGHATQG